MEEKQHPIFRQFVFRTPLYPIQHLSEWEKISHTPLFREALFLASPDFLENSQSAKKEEKGIKGILSLFKYFSRACTRCTPFGLFAGCSVGTIGSKTRIELEPQDKYRRCTRLDMQYICALIQKLERDPAVRPQLRFFPNDSLYEIGGKLRYIEYHYRKTRRIHQVSAVEVNEYISTVLERAQNGIRTEELARSIVDKDISLEEALDFVNEMVDSQMLKSELDPSIVGGDILTVLIEKLSLHTDVRDLATLQLIKDKLNDIDSKPIGTTGNLYKDIIGLIQTIGVEYEPKFLFQTDLFKPAKVATLSENICDDLRDALLFLSATSQPVGQTNLDIFKEAFVKRYEEQTVPLAEVLDTELGLGYPYNTTKNTDVGTLIDDLIIPVQIHENTQIPFSAKDALLLRKYVDCIKNGENTIILSDSDFGLDVEKRVRRAEFLPANTISIMCSVLCDTPDERKTYIKAVNVGGAGLLGRFCHLDTRLEELIRSVTDKEKCYSPDAIVAEISHLPESRIGNISSRPLFRDFVIHYLSNSDAAPEQKITLSDLWLSVRKNRLVLTSKKYGKEVYPKLTCAHNHGQSPIPLYRFLCDMQYQHLSHKLSFGYGSVFSSFNYLPRLQYKNTILARQKWVIKSKEIAEAEKLADPEILNFFRVLMQDRNLKQHVIVPDGDNEMYIDLQNVQSLRTLLALVKKREDFSLEEFLFDPEKSIVKTQHASFTNEMVVIFS